MEDRKEQEREVLGFVSMLYSNMKIIMIHNVNDGEDKLWNDSAELEFNGFMETIIGKWDLDKLVLLYDALKSEIATANKNILSLIDTNVVQGYLPVVFSSEIQLSHFEEIIKQSSGNFDAVDLTDKDLTIAYIKNMIKELIDRFNQTTLLKSELGRLKTIKENLNEALVQRSLIAHMCMSWEVASLLDNILNYLNNTMFKGYRLDLKAMTEEHNKRKNI